MLTPVVGEAFGPIRYSSCTFSHKRSGFLSRASISPTFNCPIVRIEAIGSPKIEVYAAATLRALVFHLTSPPQQLYTIILPGHNLFDEDIRKTLTEYPDTRSQYIVMDRIRPKAFSGFMVRGKERQAHRLSVVQELGFMSVFIR